MEDFEFKDKISWNKFYVVKDCTCYSDYDIFEVSSEEFLELAQKDFKECDDKAFVGALSNAKRAIDCQIDWIISYLGYDYLNFNEKKYPNINSLIGEFENSSSTKNEASLSYKLRFIVGR